MQKVCLMICAVLNTADYVYAYEKSINLEESLSFMGPPFHTAVASSLVEKLTAPLTSRSGKVITTVVDVTDGVATLYSAIPGRSRRALIATLVSMSMILIPFSNLSPLNRSLWPCHNIQAIMVGTAASSTLANEHDLKANHLVCLMSPACLSLLTACEAVLSLLACNLRREP